MLSFSFQRHHKKSKIKKKLFPFICFQLYFQHYLTLIILMQSYLCEYIHMKLNDMYYWKLTWCLFCCMLSVIFKDFVCFIVFWWTVVLAQGIWRLYFRMLAVGCCQFTAEAIKVSRYRVCWIVALIACFYDYTLSGCIGKLVASHAEGCKLKIKSSMARSLPV